MLRTGIADSLRDNQLAEGFLRPDYDDYSFYRVPGTLASTLDVDLGPTLPGDVLDGETLPDDLSTVVLLFIDAYGWNQFARTHAELPFFATIGEQARVTPLTSGFPSETSACVPSIHTASAPIQHGLLGWDAYDPTADVVYSPLPYQARDGGDIHIDPEDLFDGDQIYPELRDAGVETHAVSPAEHRESGIQVDATFHGYSSIGAFAATLRRTIDDADDPAYIHAYFPGIDGVAHREGPTAAAHDAELAALGSALDRELSKVDSPEDVLVCLVADHGQVGTSPENNTVFPDSVLKSIRRDRSNTPIVTGSPRNIHLHLRDDADPQPVRDAILETEADVLVRTRAEALDDELWGPGEPGTAFERNCGDLIVIPRRNAAWWNADDPELSLQGLHGGLHPDEVLVPFAPATLSDLTDAT